MDQLCPPKSVDPMTVLPRELAEQILEYLSFRQRMNACLVSKPWTQFIRSIPNLWRHLDLSGAKRKVRTTFISRAINTGRTKIQAATLSNLYDFDKTLVALVKHCPLEELTLMECGLQSANLTKDLLSNQSLKSLRMLRGAEFTAGELYYLMTALAARLEIFECSVRGYIPPKACTIQCEKLTSLTLDLCENFSTDLLVDLAKRMPALQSLSVHQAPGGGGLLRGLTVDLRGCAQLRHVDLGLPIMYTHMLRLPPSLTVLRVHSSRGVGLPTSMLPRLEELHVGVREAKLPNIGALLSLNANSDHTYPDPLPPYPSSAPVAPETTGAASKLRRLTVTNPCHGCTPSQVEQLLAHERLNELEELSFSGLLGIFDETAAIIASAGLKKLRGLDLSSTSVTGVGVKKLVSTYSLERLVLNECRTISTDAVEWARARGVQVKYRVTDPSTGGKKVRY